jgi:hypothetical protein
MGKYMPQARLEQEHTQIIPGELNGKHCDDCHFFTHHGNYEENFCGLYMRYTENDTTANGNYRSEKRPRPKFCKDQIIDLRVK